MIIHKKLGITYIAVHTPLRCIRQRAPHHQSKKMKKYISTISILIISIHCFGQLDTFTDVRDNKTYRTVDLNGIKWMVDNLDFDSDYSYELDSIEALNLNLTGRYYPFFEKDAVCPNGWTLPRSDDWLNYFHYIYDSLEVASDIQAYDKFYPKVLHNYVESTNFDLFTENNPIELKPNNMIQGGKLVKTGTAHYWTEHKDEEFENKSHVHLRQNTLIVHSHQKHLQRKKPKRMRMFMVRCVSKTE